MEITKEEYIKAFNRFNNKLIINESFGMGDSYLTHKMDEEDVLRYNFNDREHFAYGKIATWVVDELRMPVAKLIEKRKQVDVYRINRPTKKLLKKSSNFKDATKLYCELNISLFSTTGTEVKIESAKTRVKGKTKMGGSLKVVDVKSIEEALESLNYKVENE